VGSFVPLGLLLRNLTSHVVILKFSHSEIGRSSQLCLETDLRAANESRIWGT
jgi:hypothetical protein